MAIAKFLDCMHLARRGWRTMAMLSNAAKFNLFLSLDCARFEGRIKILPSGIPAFEPPYFPDGGRMDHPLHKSGLTSRRTRAHETSAVSVSVVGLTVKSRRVPRDTRERLKWRNMLSQCCQVTQRKKNPDTFSESDSSWERSKLLFKGGRRCHSTLLE